MSYDQGERHSSAPSVLPSFNLRARGGRDLSLMRREKWAKLFQSTRRAGRAAHYLAAVGILPVLIHAPARGATHKQSQREQGAHVSIRASARGATFRDGEGVEFLLVSIRAPARGATQDRQDHAEDIHVSIHAPARGATPYYINAFVLGILIILFAKIIKIFEYFVDVKNLF